MKAPGEVTTSHLTMFSTPYLKPPIMVHLTHGGATAFGTQTGEKMNELTTNNPEMPNWDAIHRTSIRNNRFRCEHGWDIDLDDGSSNYDIYNNLCLSGGIKLREGFYRTVENNIMINNSFHPHVWFSNCNDVFRRNIVMTAYRDIRLDSWGKEVDSNLFPDEKALKTAQANGTDTNSAFGDPLFVDPANGNFNVKENSPALSIGFVNFPMDQFGVQQPELKAIAKTPEIPKLWSLNGNSNSGEKIFEWLGAKIKTVETIEERSAAGLHETAGVLIKAIDKNSIIGKSELAVGEVIIEAQGEPVKNVKDLMGIYQGHKWKGKLELVIIKNQKPNKVLLVLK